VVRDAPLTMFNGNRLQLLLNYVETDILDTHKQATAFNLVKAIVGRRIEDEKVPIREGQIIFQKKHHHLSCRFPMSLNTCRKLSSPPSPPASGASRDKWVPPAFESNYYVLIIFKNLKIDFQVLLLYLTVHPQGQRSYEHWMEFFLNQMEYELEDGRMSALEMVHAMLNQFTEVNIFYGKKTGLLYWDSPSTESIVDLSQLNPSQKLRWTQMGTLVNRVLI
jgi:hypothetical protein